MRNSLKTCFNAVLGQNSNLPYKYCQSDTKVIGVCTECSPNYSVDEESSTVNPIFLDFKDLNLLSKYFKILRGWQHFKDEFDSIY